MPEISEPVVRMVANRWWSRARGPGVGAPLAGRVHLAAAPGLASGGEALTASHGMPDDIGELAKDPARFTADGGAGSTIDASDVAERSS
jgi:hypothetical protein